MAEQDIMSEIETLELQLRKAEISQKIKEAENWTYAREKQLIEARGKGADMTDIFKQSESTNKSLMEALQGGGDTQPTYLTTPAASAEKQTPNYLLYAGLAVGAYLLFFRGKRK